MARAPLLLILSAPSGGGKTTLGQRLLQTCPGLERAVTCTTRTPRPGERDGVDYHFLSPAVFGRQVRAGQFLEHATVHGHRYGTREREVTDRLARGCDVLLIIDVQGAAAVRARAAAHPALRNALVTVFLTPPSFAALEQRLRGRGTDPERAIQRRLRTARAELERWRDFDYLILSASPDDDLGRARAILTAEQLRPQRIATVNPHR
ncbi:MAG: guanylate kinase [Verrucomicrobia bacterium]|nr:guanylate kinase [Verrucomicrobiota bacterium]